MTHLHAVLQVGVVVSVGTSSFNELVDGVDLGFVTNKALLNLVEALEDITLEQLVLLGVVLHVVVGNLLLKALFVLTHHLSNYYQTVLLVLEVVLELVSLGEFVLNFIFHLVDAFGDLLEFVVNSVLQVFNLLEVTSTSVYLNLKFSRGALSII